MLLDKKNRMANVNRSFRHLVEIWDPKHEVENEVGEITHEKVKIDSIWADVKPLRGREYFEAQKIVPELTYKITTRYRSHITPHMLIKWQSRELNINSIIDVSGREEHMEIMCTEKRAK